MSGVVVLATAMGGGGGDVKFDSPLGGHLVLFPFLHHHGSGAGSGHW